VDGAGGNAGTYELFASSGAAPEPAGPRRFYWGGNIYDDWSDVPDQYKAPTTDPQPGQYTATIFRFSW